MKIINFSLLAICATSLFANSANPDVITQIKSFGPHKPYIINGIQSRFPLHLYDLTPRNDYFLLQTK